MAQGLATEATAIVGGVPPQKHRRRTCPQDMRHGASLWAVPVASNAILVTGLPVALMGVLWRNLPRDMALALGPREIFTGLSAAGMATAALVLVVKKASSISPEKRNAAMLNLYVVELILGAMSAYQGVSLSIANRALHLAITEGRVLVVSGASLALGVITGLFFPSLRRLAPLVAAAAQDVERKVKKVVNGDQASIDLAHRSITDSFMQYVSTTGVGCRRVKSGKPRAPGKSSRMEELQKVLLPTLNGVLVYNNIKTLMDAMSLTLGRVLPGQSPAFFVVALTLLGQVGIEWEGVKEIPWLLRAMLRRSDELSNALQGTIQTFYALNILVLTPLLWRNPDLLQTLSDNLETRDQAVSSDAIMALSIMLAVSVLPGFAVGLTHHLLSALNTGLSTKVPDLFGRMRDWLRRKDAEVDVRGGVVTIADLARVAQVSHRRLSAIRRDSQVTVSSLGGGASDRSLPVPDETWTSNPLQTALTNFLRASTPVGVDEAGLAIVSQLMDHPDVDEEALATFVKQASERGRSNTVVVWNPLGSGGLPDYGTGTSPAAAALDALGPAGAVATLAPEKKWAWLTPRVAFFLTGTALMLWRGIECAGDSGCDWKADARGVVAMSEGMSGRRQLAQGADQQESGVDLWSWLMMIVMMLAVLPPAARAARECVEECWSTTRCFGLSSNNDSKRGSALESV